MQLFSHRWGCASSVDERVYVGVNTLFNRYPQVLPRTVFCLLGNAPLIETEPRLPSQSWHGPPDDLGLQDV
jgi:hypothetical protein